jgi:hypothetical protein
MRTTDLRFAAACCAGALLLVSSSSPARAQAAVARVDPLSLGADPEGGPPLSAPEYRFDGRAIYLGAGPGIIADLHEPTFDAAAYLTLPITTWMMFEGAGSLTHLGATDHHGDREQTNGLGIGAGLRFAPFELGPVRPYLAARFAHIHFWPDPWGEHVEHPDGTHDHTSMHRWGGAIGAGLDAPLSASLERWRIGLDLQAMALSGPSANVLLHAAVTLGFGI